MKKIKTLLVATMAVVFVMSIPSCKKDGLQKDSDDAKVVMLKETGTLIKQMLADIKNARTTLQPVIWDKDTIALDGPGGYDKIKAVAMPRIMASIMRELKPDSGLTTNGDIALVADKFLDGFWEDPEDTWDNLEVGIHEDVYRLCPAFGEALLTFMKNYCEGNLTGKPGEYSGTRHEPTENAIRDLIGTLVPDIDYKYGYIDFFGDYIRSYSHNPDDVDARKSQPTRDWTGHEKFDYVQTKAKGTDRAQYVEEMGAFTLKFKNPHKLNAQN
jgi:hypothetical protein